MKTTRRPWAAMGTSVVGTDNVQIAECCLPGDARLIAQSVNHVSEMREHLEGLVISLLSPRVGEEDDPIQTRAMHAERFLTSLGQ